MTLEEFFAWVERLDDQIDGLVESIRWRARVVGSPSSDEVAAWDGRRLWHLATERGWDGAEDCEADSESPCSPDF